MKKNKYTYKHAILLLWLGVIVGIPFVVRVKSFTLSYPLDMVFPTQGNQVYDFMLYYKGLLLNILVFTLGVGIVGQKLMMKQPPQIVICNDKSYRIHTLSIIGYLICIILSFMGSSYKTLSMVGAPNSYESIVVIVSYGLILLLSIQYFQDVFYIDGVFKWLDILIIGLSLLGIVEFFYKSIIEMKWFQYLILPSSQWSNIGTLVDQAFTDQISLTLFNPNYAGLLLMMLVWIGIAKIRKNDGKKKYFYAGLFIVLIMAFFFTRSTAVFYALIVGGVIEAVIYRKEILEHKKMVLIMIGIIGGIFFVVDSSKGYILSKTFLGDLGAYQSESGIEPYTVDAFILEDNKLIIANAEGKLYIEVQYPLKVSEVTGRYEGENGINYELRQVLEGDTITFEEELFKPIRITCMEDKMVLDLGYDEPVYFQVYDNSKLYAIGPNGYLLERINNDSGIGFDSYQGFATGRGYIWRKSLPALITSGLLGTGPDTTSMYIPQNDFAGKLNYHGSVSLIIDKPHSLYLQIGIQTGILSLVCIGSLFAYYLCRATMTLVIQSKNKVNTYYDFAVALYVGHIGYMLCGLAYDSNLATAPFFWVTLGLNIVLIQKIQRESKG